MIPNASACVTSATTNIGPEHTLSLCIAGELQVHDVLQMSDNWDDAEKCMKCQMHKTREEFQMRHSKNKSQPKGIPIVPHDIITTCVCVCVCKCVCVCVCVYVLQWKINYHELVQTIRRDSFCPRVCMFDEERLGCCCQSPPPLCLILQSHILRSYRQRTLWPLWRWTDIFLRLYSTVHTDL